MKDLRPHNPNCFYIYGLLRGRKWSPFKAKTWTKGPRPVIRLRGRRLLCTISVTSDTLHSGGNSFFNSSSSSFLLFILYCHLEACRSLHVSETVSRCYATLLRDKLHSWRSLLLQHRWFSCGLHTSLHTGAVFEYLVGWALSALWGQFCPQTVVWCVWALILKHPNQSLHVLTTTFVSSHTSQATCISSACSSCSLQLHPVTLYVSHCVSSVGGKLVTCDLLKGQCLLAASDACVFIECLSSEMLLPVGMCSSPWAAPAVVIDFDFDCPVSILTGCEKSNKTEGSACIEGV